MTAVPVAPDAREQEIAGRWRNTVDQVTQSTNAIRARRPELANTRQELAARRERLARRRVEFEGIVGADDSVWPSFLSCGLRAARAVGRIVLPAQPRRHLPERPVGTGVLVAPGALLTNHHVVDSAGTAAGMTVQFGYEYGDDGAPVPHVECRLDPRRCFHTDAELDFTVLAVADPDGGPPGARFGTVPLIEETGKIIKGERLNVVHHPGGGYKRLSIRDNRMVAEDELWLRYTSDTGYGSSGAPVFNDQWEMVALHHGGVRLRDDRGAPLDRDGRPWSGDMGAEAVAYVANEGARISRIVRRLRVAVTAPATRTVLDEVLAAGSGT